MDATELKYHRINTEAFIAVKPTSIVLIPQTKTPTPAGGYIKRDGTPRPAQTFRIIELGANQAPPVLELTDGTQREAEFWLLGLHDAEIQIDDHWAMIDPATGRERDWLVGDIVRPNGYETRALVVERGQ